jgi:DNA-binding MarR family transcriptional regulator
MSKRRPMTRREDAVEALKLFTDEFSYKDYAEVLDLNPSAAQRWLKIFEEEGLIFKFRDPEMTTNGRRCYYLEGEVNGLHFRRCST